MTEAPATVLWQAGPPLSLSDRGWCYGDGVFETLLCTPRGLWLLPRHLRRLERGLAALALEAPPRDQLAELLDEARSAYECSGSEHAVLKLFASAADGPRGYRRGRGHPIVLRAQLQLRAAVQANTTVVCRVSSHRLPESAALSGLKHLARVEQVLGALPLADWVCDELLLADKAGRLCCATAGNLLLECAGELLTPPVHGSMIEGTLLQTLRDQEELRIREATLDLSMLPQANGLWSVNSIAGAVRLIFQDDAGQQHGQGDSHFATPLIHAVDRSLARDCSWSLAAATGTRR
ncbi:MAG: aminotransferase class IV [Pseudomonadota bacterium]